MSGRLQYLPALDGLRAIAVVSVLLYHLDISWAAGGFLGVDLFFVISGFLITTLLMREDSATGRIDIRSFWVRRFRRLVPPLVAMTIATVVAARLWGLPEQWTSIRWDAISALGYVANWRFVVAGQSYFDVLIGPSPLRHTWSLAVEEQWYLLWPVVMLGILALMRRRGGSTIALGLLALATVLSAVLMAVLYVAEDPSRVYYGTDTRAQQLLVGAALAVAANRWPRILTIGQTTAPATAVLGAVGVFLLIVNTVTDQSPGLYHGGFLAISLLCAALVAATASTHVARPLRWLESAPLIWIGVRSYGIYLWHWPVIVFVGRPMGIEFDGIGLIALQVALSIALADASHRLIERPLRTATWRPISMIVTWSGVAAVAAIMSVVVLTTPADRTLTSAESIQPIARETTTPPTASVGPAPATAAPPTLDDAVPTITIPATTTPATTTPATTVPAGPPRALVVGDSMALRLVGARNPENQAQWDIQGSARLGCGFASGQPMDSDSSSPIQPPDECAVWRSEFSGAAGLVQPDVAVVMIGAWDVLDHRVDDVDVRFPNAEWFDLVRSAVDEVTGTVLASSRHVLLLTLPCMEPSGDDRTTARTDQARVDAFNTILAEVAEENSNVDTFDTAALLCPAGEYRETFEGDVLRYDGVHLTAAGADYVWSQLVPEMERLAAR